MSRRLLAFLLAELDTIRLVCRIATCNRIIELSLDDLAKKPVTRCPFCQAQYDPLAQGDHLKDFARAVAGLRQLDKTVLGVEFVLPEGTP